MDNLRIEYGRNARGLPYRLSYRVGGVDYVVWHDDFMAPVYATSHGTQRKVEFGALPEWPRARSEALLLGLFDAARRRGGAHPRGPVLDPEAALDRVLGRIRGYLATGQKAELVEAVSLGEFTLAVLQRVRREAEARARRAPIPAPVEFDE